ncbi:MAG: tRNA uridine-5-carboxymethylaminomethyl(34) synthesis GTPase MnmE, partial [FCB group bacterium]|nr:tRNA uridine-5-carboxymethylaminomethyl(34) synthesis GTPase MnmE [FCB group bacterium]
MSAYKKDRIAALATPPGPGALAVIRISGENLSGLIPQLTGQNSLAPRYALYTSILSPVDGETLDKGIVTFFNSPHSFTGEDVIEISCHGGEHIPRSILSALYASGVRPANPGEFSFRAFINGKIDLVQAESITTLISAKTSKGVSASLSGLSGKLTSNIDVLKIQLLNTLSMIEHELDFSEDEISHIEIKTYIHSIEQVGITLSSILESAAFGKAVFNGVRVVLIGRPNTGKSSLFNSILGHERAIVSSVPGTTRDTIESWFDLDGFPVCIVDTAGLWDSDNYLESIGIKRTR